MSLSAEGVLFNGGNFFNDMEGDLSILGILLRGGLTGSMTELCRGRFTEEIREGWLICVVGGVIVDVVRCPQSFSVSIVNNNNNNSMRAVRTCNRLLLAGGCCMSP